jgi:hypothetical protein
VFIPGKACQLKGILIAFLMNILQILKPAEKRAKYGYNSAKGRPKQKA